MKMAERPSNPERGKGGGRRTLEKAKTSSQWEKKTVINFNPEGENWKALGEV